MRELENSFMVDMTHFIVEPKELAVLLCNEYEVGEEDALKDVEKQLCEWKQSGLVG